MVYRGKYRRQKKFILTINIQDINIFVGHLWKIDFNAKTNTKVGMLRLFIKLFIKWIKMDKNDHMIKRNCILTELIKS